MLDADLLAEERFSKVIAQNENLTKDRRELQSEVSELHERLSRLQEHNVSGGAASSGRRV